MHGQKRSEYKSRLLHIETSNKLATKAKQWNHLSNELLTHHRHLLRLSLDDDDGSSSSTSSTTPPPSPAILLSLTGNMLIVNPDPSHLWNIRRELLLLPLLQAKKGKADYDDSKNHAVGVKEDKQAITNTTITFNIDKLQEEFKLTAHCLQRNPKSYAAWHHRKWSIAHYLTHTALPPPLFKDDDHPTATTAAAASTRIGMNQEVVYDTTITSVVKQMLSSEMELVSQFLLLDERNFHCWNYRRFIVAILGTTATTIITTDTTTQGTVSSVTDFTESTFLTLHNDVLPLLYSGSWSSWWHSDMSTQQEQNSQNVISMGAQLLPKYDTMKMREGEAATTAVAKVTSSSSSSSLILPTATTIQELSDIIHMECNFTTTKIYDNFSNGSAFHYRTKLLPLLLECKLLQLSSHEAGGTIVPVIITVNIRYKEMLTLARNEWEDILLNAIYTEPDDQTPWWYHRFIVSWMKPPTTSTTQQLLPSSTSSSSSLPIEDEGGVDDELVQEYETLLFEMINSLRELLEVEKENDDNTSSDTPTQRDESKGAKCKWAYIGLHIVLSTLLLESKSLNNKDATNLRDEAEECLNKLIIIDPNRKERYQQLSVDVKR